MNIREKYTKGFKEHVNTLGVFSLAEHNNSIQMWSYYGDSHEGFCLGFKNKIKEQGHYIAEVSYSDDRNNDIAHLFLSLTNLERAGASEDDILEKLIRDYACTKFTAWQLEQEWRIMGDVGVKDYSDECLDSITFGLNMPHEERDKIRKLVTNKNIKFFEAVKNPLKFLIDIRSCT